MKPLQKFIYAVAAMAAVIFVACAEEPLQNPVVGAKAEAIENPDYEIIRALGFNTEDITEYEDYYIVEGDIAIKRDSIEFYMPKTRQAYHSKIANGRENGIRVKVSSVSVQNDDWRHAAIEAIRIWNDVPNCNVHFNAITLQILDAEVRIEDRKSLSKYTVAVGALPQNGKPGDHVHIDNKYDTLAYDKKIYVMVHELGHILGLQHTNQDNDLNWEHIAGTPDWGTGQGDDDSVMRGTTADRYWGDWEWGWGWVWDSASSDYVSSSNALTRGHFTAGDLAAIQSLYGTPIWSSEIAGSSTYWPVFGSTYTLNLETNLINPNIAWYVNNVVRQSGSSFSFTPTSMPSGQVTLKAVANYGGTTRETSKVITVSNPFIAAPYAPALNVTQTYSVPTPPAGVTFNGWTITGGGYAANGGVREYRA